MMLPIATNELQIFDKCEVALMTAKFALYAWVVNRDTPVGMRITTLSRNPRAQSGQAQILSRTARSINSSSWAPHSLSPSWTKYSSPKDARVVGHHVRTPILEILNPPTLDIGRVYINPVVAEYVRLCHDKSDGEKFAVAQSTRRLHHPRGGGVVDSSN